MAYVESRFQPLAIGVNGGPRPTQPADRAEAVVLTRRLLETGANLDLGLAQINSDNLDWLGLTIEEAFDPCRNLAAAAQVLRAGYQTTASPQRALRIALSRYNTGHPERGFRNGYVAKVEAAARDLDLAIDTVAPPVVGPDPLEGEPSETPAAWDVFGRARLATTAVLAPIHRPWRDQ